MNLENEKNKKQNKITIISEEEHLKRLPEHIIHLFQNDEKEWIKFLDEKLFINYSFVQMLFNEILDLLEQPIRPRMIGMLLYSPTNNGKTTLIVRFIESYANEIDGNLIFVETPERVTLKEFYVEILIQLGYPAKSKKSTGDLRRKILEKIKEKNISILFIDEIQNLLDSRRDHKNDIINGLKALSNKAKIPIVLSGTDRAIEIVADNLEILGRFIPFELPIWNYNNEFRTLLATFEINLPLKKPSNLHLPDISKKIWQYCSVENGARIGRIHELLRKCAKKAIREKKDFIDIELIDEFGKKWKKYEDILKVPIKRKLKT